MKLALIIALLVLFWYIRNKGIRSARKGQELRRKLRRQAFERSVPPEEE